MTSLSSRSADSKGSAPLSFDSPLATRSRSYPGVRDANSEAIGLSAEGGVEPSIVGRVQRECELAYLLLR